MILRDPDSRRALRSIVQAVVVLVALGFTGRIIWLAKSELTLRLIANWLLGITAIGTLGYILENGLRSVSAKAFGASFDASTSDAPAAASAVADAAVEKAVEIKEQSQ